ncbi:MAG: hypothetical protein JSV21_02125 [Nitrospirota bacterium]|nr:MAG: hypothetical protein JSV21_02125 [Nitrospirota bacterium]
MPENTEERVYQLKKMVFFDLLDTAGRVFIVVNHSENVEIGKRGFLPEEKKNGLVLVFNSQMDFRWEEEGIHANLVFDGSKHRCFVPMADIIAIYSPEAQAQFITAPGSSDPKRAEIRENGSSVHGSEDIGKVVQVDFKKKEIK